MADPNSQDSEKTLAMDKIEARIPRGKVHEDTHNSGSSTKPPSTSNLGQKEEATEDPTQERVSLTTRALGWLQFKRLAVIFAFVTAISQLFGPVSAVNDLADLGSRMKSLVVDERAAIEDAVRTHYEAIGARDFGTAYELFGPIQKAQAGSEKMWVEGQTKFCPVTKSRIRNVEVGEIGVDSAIATATVHFDHVCGESDWVFIWNMLKVDGGWKLDSQKSTYTTFSSVPRGFDNGGLKESRIAGNTLLEAVSTSDTAVPDHDAGGRVITFEPDNLVDKKPETAWQVAGNGKGEWILMEYERPIKITRIGFIPGYTKVDPVDGTDGFYQNYVVRKVRIEFSDGFSETAKFDRAPAKQYVDVPNIETSSVRITVLDTYPPGDDPSGGTYKELFGKTAISEIEVVQ